MDVRQGTRPGWLKGIATVAVALVAASGAWAAEKAPAVATPTVDSGDTAWVLMSAALVLLMTPGLAFFYGGLVRRKNVLSILMQCLVLMCLVTVQWVAVGYSLAFGPSHGGWIGSLAWGWLAGVGDTPNPAYAATIPHETFMLFQMMFAIITPALIIGAFAERMKFASFVLFSLLWTTLVYDPVAHWVWNADGWLHKAGALDFAGGTVVHVNAGMAALAAALVLGKRKGIPERVSPPHNLPFAVLGAGLLWFGWFGFNAGSALKAGPLASGAFAATHIACASAGLMWAVLDGLFAARATVLGIITGAVAGLVAITPAAGYVTPAGAVGIGFVSSALCYWFVAVVKERMGYDDALDAFGVHGVGGMWGAVATGLWATTLANPGGANGLFAGGGIGPVAIQVKAVAVTGIYSFVASWLLLKFVDATTGLRVGDQEERIGLDLTQHRESGYTVLE